MKRGHAVSTATEFARYSECCCFLLGFLYHFDFGCYRTIYSFPSVRRLKRKDNVPGEQLTCSYALSCRSRTRPRRPFALSLSLFNLFMDFFCHIVRAPKKCVCFRSLFFIHLDSGLFRLLRN